MLRLMIDSDNRQISAGTWLETCIVVNQRRQPKASAIFETILSRLSLTIIPATGEQARVARRAYGRGNRPARLNYGDCFAYALAKVAGEPLLFKGNVFSQTDTPALRA